VFGAAFNDMFLVHVIAFSSSIFALIVTAISVDASAIAARYRTGARVRAVAGLLVVVCGVFAILWSSFSISYALSGRLSLGAATLEGMHTVFAIDLSLMVPAMALAGVLLWRRRPWGFVLGAAMSIFGAVYQLNLAAAGWFQVDAGVENVRRIDPVGAVFLVLFLLAATVMIRELRPAERRLR
jgi:Na+-transporting methylmalonyl-CoA/oxaloacetate decarboxylase gamma subunit